MAELVGEGEGEPKEPREVLPPIELQNFQDLDKQLGVPDSVQIQFEDNTIVLGEQRRDLTPNLTVFFPPKDRKCRILYFPIFTILITLVDIIVFIWLLAKCGFAPPSENPMLGPSVQCLLDNGGKYGPAIKNGDWWRFITPIFIHAGFIHLFSNLIGQWVFCWMYDKEYTFVRVALVYFISGIGGVLLSAIIIPELVSVGASGAIFGMFGMYIVDIVQNFRRISNPIKTVVFSVIILIISFVIGLWPLVDNWAHIGGFLFGVVAAIVIIPTFHYTLRWKRIGRLVCTLAFIPVLIGMFAAGFYIFYNVIDVNGWCPQCQSITNL